MLTDRAEGAALFGSVWASSEAMSAGEETEAPLRAELAKRAGTPMLPIPARGREASGQAAGPMHSGVRAEVVNLRERGQLFPAVGDPQQRPVGRAL